MVRSFPLNSEGQIEFEMHEMVGDVNNIYSNIFRLLPTTLSTFATRICQIEIDSWSKRSLNNLQIAAPNSNLSQSGTWYRVQ